MQKRKKFEILMRRELLFFLFQERVGEAKREREKGEVAGSRREGADVGAKRQKGVWVF